MPRAVTADARRARPREDNAMLLKPFVPLMIAALALGAGCTRDEVLEIEFPPGIEGQFVPISLELPPHLADSSALWEVIPPDCKRGKSAHAQPLLDRTGEARGEAARWKVAFLWDPATGSKGNTKYFIWRGAAPDVQPAFSFEDDGAGTLTVLQDGRPVLGYVHGMKLKPGAPEDRARSCYVWPVYGLDGEPMADDFPEDHLHHRGIFWTWPQVYVGDSPDTLSLWDIRGIHQRFERWLEPPAAGPVFAELGALNGWYVGEKRVLEEKVRVRVYRAGNFGRMIDFEFVRTAQDEPVTVKGSPDEKGYGGFGMRMAPFTEAAITTSEGPQSEDSNRMPFPWADFSAKFGGGEKVSGAAIFQSPENDGFPNGWCLRHYGLMGMAWPGLDEFVFRPGVPVAWRYRVWLHRGDVDWGRVASAYGVYANPVRARVLHEPPKEAESGQAGR